MCSVQGVQCVLYNWPIWKIYRRYRYRYQTWITLIQTVFRNKEHLVWCNINWVYTFWKHIFWFLSLFNSKSPEKYFFLCTIYLRLCWHHVHIRQGNAIFGHKKIICQLSLYFLRHTWGKHPTKQLVLVSRAYSWAELLLFCIFMTSMEISSKSLVDFEET